MKKHSFPIIEFDSDTTAFINPTGKALKQPLHERVVICFFHEIIDQLEKEGILTCVDVLKGENAVPIYMFNDIPVSLVPGRLGAPACAGYFEDFIAHGAKHIMFCGGAGVLSDKVSLGHYVLVDSAIRDEGTSYHYLPPSREVKADARMLEHIKQYLDRHGVPYITGKTWTTDAFYRETAARIAARKEEGALVVEMEQAAMFAVSQFRDVRYGAILYGGDDLTQSVWDGRGWRTQPTTRRALTLLCKDILMTIDN